MWRRQLPYNFKFCTETQERFHLFSFFIRIYTQHFEWQDTRMTSLHNPAADMNLTYLQSCRSHYPLPPPALPLPRHYGKLSLIATISRIPPCLAHPDSADSVVSPWLRQRSLTSLNRVGSKCCPRNRTSFRVFFATASLNAIPETLSRTTLHGTWKFVIFDLLYAYVYI